MMENNTTGFDDDPPPEPRDGWLLVRIHVPELNVYKCLQFPADRLVWDVKQQVLASLPKVAFWFKELKESFNYGLFCPPSNGKAGKFLDEERRLGDYPFNGPVGYLELKYKRRVYKMLNLDERQLKALHTRANLRRFLECVNGGHVEKIAKMCAKGLDPNFHCPESGETPLTVATGAKKPNKLLIALVNGGALLDYRTKDGATALHKAVEKDSLEGVTTLLELGASPNYKDGRGITPLYTSVTKKCDPKITESLLHDHATLGIQDNQGWQEVHQACRHGLVQHLEHLLFYGADMDGRNASGNTPLHVCAVNNQEACARMLLFRGAQREALNYANQTPYQVAVIAGNLELAEVIQNYKTDEIVPFRGPPRYNPKRRSGVGWMAGNGSLISGGGSFMGTLTRNSSCGPPSPCPSEHMPYSSASSSLSEGSSGHRSHEDDISIVTDKSLGDTSDIISDSSGVGTNSDSAACSIGHPSTTVVCMEPYAGNSVGHIRLQPGDVIEVVGSTDCGLLEGYVRGTNASGFFPVECVQEVNIRQKNITNVSTATNISNSHHQQQNQQFQGSPGMQRLQGPTTNGGGGVGHYNSSTAPRVKKPVMGEPRTVVLHRAKRGFGFILRGAKASSPLMQLKPSDRFPALQYLDDVDPSGVADMAGLRPGDFLLAIGGEDVRAASHEKVVDMIRSSGALVSMTVISPQYPHQIQSAASSSAAAQQQHQQFQVQHYQGPSTPQAARQCSTLPRKMSLGQPGLGGSGRMPAPMPPRRDPKTTLSVGRARAKSMVAGLENGGEKEDEDIPAKSSSIESISTTPTQNPSTPVQLRTASIKARPTSSRITAAELEELFQRQQGEAADGMNRYSTMMTTSRFQSGTDSGAATPPSSGSPMKAPLVYASVAEMKRKKTKNGTLRGKPCAIPTVGGTELKRFHSTPDLNTHLNSSSSSIWNAIGKGHHSQDDVATLHASLQRLNLPPPTHPPPPPPVGQVVKVDVSRSSSEYESTITLQQKLQKRGDVTDSCGPADGVASSFNPSANAKLYASPQDLRNVVGWKLRRTASQENRQPLNQSSNTSAQQFLQQPPPAPPQPTAQTLNQQIQHKQQQKQQAVNAAQKCQYAQPTRQLVGQLPTHHQQQYSHPQNASPLPTGTAPPIPEPDYSLSESDGEDENSILVARNTKLNEKIALLDMPETSGNSNNSGSSSGGSISHSFSVDEIQRIRTNLKTSKSYPNDLLKHENQNDVDVGSQKQNSRSPPNAPENIEEGDNSSSGVSSDQEIPTNSAQIATNQDTLKKKSLTLSVGTTTPKQLTPLAKQQQHQQVQLIKQPTVAATKVNTLLITSKQLAPALSPSLASKIILGPNLRKHEEPITTVGSTKHCMSINNNSNHDHDTEEEQRSEDDGELSPSPPAKAFQRHNSLTRKQAASIAMARATRAAVSLVQLPPPIEADSDSEMMATSTGENGVPGNASSTENIVLAPPPQFCDCNDMKHPKSTGGATSGGANVANSTGNRVRIVGAVPKANRLNSQ
ncbi:SH3 and multiple ankyrin repeat domains protein 2 isoform X2 [Eupeodes corollae]|uniref:SH3 and multiple ankyrin repeat domains protein 2 isoform X2 n=1 Tax=Eupeodes corollae TaxID=290404 RepID=UPI00248FB4AD|nr:SH3 and multiple ankyrin repeat domains protein 2 isoform X2 [Eupeodes corollae]